MIGVESEKSSLSLNDVDGTERNAGARKVIDNVLKHFQLNNSFMAAFCFAIFPLILSLLRLRTMPWWCFCGSQMKWTKFIFYCFTLYLARPCCMLVVALGESKQWKIDAKWSEWESPPAIQELQWKRLIWKIFLPPKRRLSLHSHSLMRWNLQN